ncbi:MAG: hypothetical protein U9R00_02825 [Patescibacteria group bacterium]|nr:hypothetical protein [Patescibacteria group bacterium]
MKNIVKKIKNYFKSKKRFRRKSYNPHKNWNIILISSLITILCLVGFSLYINYVIKNDNFIQVDKFDSSQQINELKQNLLDDVVKKFKDKQKNLEEIKSSKWSLSDPSL